MKTAIYPGMFDPITLGHLDVLERALKLFDRVVVAVTDNPKKRPFFSLQERMGMVRETTKGMNGVEAKSFSSLLVDFAKQERAIAILRGLRELSDFEFEFQQAIVNRKLNPNIETIFVMTGARYFYLSSSMVKEISSLGGDVSRFVPPAVEKQLKKKRK